MEKKEFKIELKQKSKITGMRCDSENAGNCRGCYYHKLWGRLIPGWKHK